MPALLEISMQGIEQLLMDAADFYSRSPDGQYDQVALAALNFINDDPRAFIDSDAGKWLIATNQDID